MTCPTPTTSTDTARVGGPAVVHLVPAVQPAGPTVGPTDTRTASGASDDGNNRAEAHGATAMTSTTSTMTTSTTSTRDGARSATGLYVADTRKASTKRGLEAILSQRALDDDIAALKGQSARTLLAAANALDIVAAYLAARDGFRERRAAAIAAGLLTDDDHGSHLLAAATGCLVAAAKRLSDGSRAIGTLATAMGVGLGELNKYKSRDYRDRAAMAVEAVSGATDPTGEAV